MRAGATAMEITTGDRAVRNYLLFLHDPNQLIDTDEVERIQQRITAAVDPLDRLRGLAELHRAQQADEASHRTAFIVGARAWAEANDVPWQSFIEMGVDPAVLREAGFDVAGEPQPRANTRRRRSKVRGRTSVVTTQDVQRAIRGLADSFTLVEIAAAGGGSPMTVRKAVEEMIANGELERAGTRQDPTKPGRSPKLYRNVAH